MSVARRRQIGIRVAGPSEHARAAPARQATAPRCGRTNPRPDFDRTARSGKAPPKTLAGWNPQCRAACGLRVTSPTGPGRRAALRLPLPNSGASVAKPSPCFFAELNPAPPARFVFGHQSARLPRDSGGAALPHLCLARAPPFHLHSLNVAWVQMGCSDATLRSPYVGTKTVCTYFRFAGCNRPWWRRALRCLSAAMSQWVASQNPACDHGFELYAYAATQGQTMKQGSAFRDGVQFLVMSAFGSGTQRSFLK